MMDVRTLRAVTAITAMLLVGALVGMASMVSGGYKVTQLRNAFIAQPGNRADFDWLPDSAPSEFLNESGVPPADFHHAARTLLEALPENESELDRTLALARHLASGPGPGPGVKSSTSETYKAILTERRGYCSDYTQVLNGLGYAAGIPIREWGLSFDEYSGDGHGFSEIYDRKLGKWVFVDSFYSMYVVDRSNGVPVSVLELRERLAAGAGVETLEVEPIVRERFGFRSPEKALEYYRRGADQFFLYFGNNVFSYDANPIVAAMSGVSRAAEESAGIALGIRPGIRLVQTDSNAAAIEGLLYRRTTFLALTALVVTLPVAIVFELRSLRRLRR